MANNILKQFLLGTQQNIRSYAKAFSFLNTLFCMYILIMLKTRSREELRINNLDQIIRVVMQPKNKSSSKFTAMKWCKYLYFIQL
jgi:hypothetical protein